MQKMKKVDTSEIGDHYFVVSRNSTPTTEDEEVMV